MSIKPGMSLEQVLAILGRPYTISIVAPLHNQTCTSLYSGMEQDLSDSMDIRQAAAQYYSDTDYCCAANKSCRQSSEQRLTLTYTRPEPGILDYPMLWVHLDRDYRVYSVFAKRYDFLDDEAVYSCSKVKPADVQQKDTCWMWMKEETFKDCFP